MTSSTAAPVSDTMYGGDGADDVHGKSGDDRLFGEANPADKPDDVAGGSGSDRV